MMMSLWCIYGNHVLHVIECARACTLQIAIGTKNCETAVAASILLLSLEMTKLDEIPLELYSAIPLANGLKMHDAACNVVMQVIKNSV